MGSSPKGSDCYLTRVSIMNGQDNVFVVAVVVVVIGISVFVFVEVCGEFCAR